MMNSYSFHQSSTSTPKSKSRDYYSSPNTDLIYRCPVVECGKAFSKLGGIFKYLVPAHGYQGVLFRMEHNVPGLSMICETCKWNYADKNAIYKHRKVINSSFFNTLMVAFKNRAEMLKIETKALSLRVEKIFLLYA